MEQLFNFDLKKISSTSDNESLDRKKYLDLFLEKGFPNKKDENWKFTDLNYIISKNFKNITNNFNFSLDKKIELINDFEHNYIFTINGSYKSCDIRFEDKTKVKIENLKLSDGFDYQSSNSLVNLNKALSQGGFNLEIQDNYKCKKPIVIYNYFTSNLSNEIINNSNKIRLNQNSELTLIEYNVGVNSKFIKNTFEKIDIDKGSILKSINIQKKKIMVIFIKIYLDHKGITPSFKILYSAQD